MCMFGGSKYILRHSSCARSSAAPQKSHRHQHKFVGILGTPKLRRWSPVRQTDWFLINEIWDKKKYIPLSFCCSFRLNWNVSNWYANDVLRLFWRRRWWILTCRTFWHHQRIHIQGNNAFLSLYLWWMAMTQSKISNIYRHSIYIVWPVHASTSNASFETWLDWRSQCYLSSSNAPALARLWIYCHLIEAQLVTVYQFYWLIYMFSNTLWMRHTIYILCCVQRKSSTPRFCWNKTKKKRRKKNMRIRYLYYAYETSTQNVRCSTYTIEIEFLPLFTHNSQLTRSNVDHTLDIIWYLRMTAVECLHSVASKHTSYYNHQLPIWKYWLLWWEKNMAYKKKKRKGKLLLIRFGWCVRLIVHFVGGRNAPKLNRSVK